MTTPHGSPVVVHATFDIVFGTTPPVTLSTTVPLPPGVTDISNEFHHCGVMLLITIFDAVDPPVDIMFFVNVEGSIEFQNVTV